MLSGAPCPLCMACHGKHCHILGHDGDRDQLRHVPCALGCERDAKTSLHQLLSQHPRWARHPAQICSCVLQPEQVLSTVLPRNDVF